MDTVVIEPVWIGTSEAAEKLGISRSKLIALMSEGDEIPGGVRYHRSGRFWKLRNSDIKALTTFGDTPSTDL